MFQYHGCHWNGCRRCFPNTRKQIINHGQTRENRFLYTPARTSALREAGCRIIEKWECDDQKTREVLPDRETGAYQHAFLYDFDKAQKQEVTEALTYKNAHVPISEGIGDTLEREPTHICNANKKELIKKFMTELERRRANIRARV